MTTKIVKKILDEFDDKDDATIILKSGKEIDFNPDAACPFINEDDILHLEGDFFAWIEVREIAMIKMKF